MRMHFELTQLFSVAACHPGATVPSVDVLQPESVQKKWIAGNS